MSTMPSQLDVLLAQGPSRWDSLFHYFHQQRDNPRLVQLVEYAERVMEPTLTAGSKFMTLEEGRRHPPRAAEAWAGFRRESFAKPDWHRRNGKLSPAFRLVRHLRFSTKSEEWASTYLGMLSESPFACRLSSLTISCSELYEGTLRRVLESPYLKDAVLEVRRTLLGDADLLLLLQRERISPETRQQARLGRLGRAGRPSRKVIINYL